MSTYIKLSTLEYPRYIGDIEIDPDGMSDYSPVEYVDPPQFDPNLQRCLQKPPEQRDGKWFMVWEVALISESVVIIPPEVIETPESLEMAKNVRIDRNQRLSICDWTQLADAPVDKAAWAAYRQSLRDITKQAGFPWAVTWPQQPN